MFVYMCIQMLQQSKGGKSSTARSLGAGSQKSFGRWKFSHNRRRWWLLQNSWESFQAAAPNRVTMPRALRSQSGPAGGRWTL